MVAKIDNEILLENHAFNIRHATIHSLAEGLGARVTWDTTEFILKIKPNNKFFLIEMETTVKLAIQNITHQLLDSTSKPHFHLVKNQ